MKKKLALTARTKLKPSIVWISADVCLLEAIRQGRRVRELGGRLRSRITSRLSSTFNICVA